MATPPSSVQDTAAAKRPREVQDLQKEEVLERLFGADGSSADTYEALVVGRRGWGALLTFELITSVLGPMPGAAGLALRKWVYPRLFKRVGSGVLWGRNIALRHPGKIELGSRVAIDDHCLLDAKGAGAQGLRIGNEVLIARDTIIQAKTSWIEIGDQCTIGSQCQLTSVGGIRIGKAVMISGQCYLGGGRYHTEDPSVPMKEQGLYTTGPVIIGDDVWLGAGVIVQDGVRIGRGSIIGAGTVVRENVPERTVVVSHQKLVMLPR